MDMEMTIKQTAIFPGRYVQSEGALQRLGEELEHVAASATLRGHDLEVIEAWSRTVGGAQAIAALCFYKNSEIDSRPEWSLLLTIATIL